MAEDSKQILTLALKALRLREASSLLVFAGDDHQWPKELSEAAGRVVWVSPLPMAGGNGIVRASQGYLPFSRGAFDAGLDWGRSQSLALQKDSEALEALSGLARVLRAGARYLCGGSMSWPPLGSRLSADKRSISEWRREGALLHHITSLRRPDGSWQRNHERFRARRFEEVEHLLNRGGFVVLNVYPRSGRLSEAAEPNGDDRLLCERE
jgi:hypothetical protein